MKAKSKSQKKKTQQSHEPLSVFIPLNEAKSGVSTSLKLIISALTLISALAWNDAIKSVFEYAKKFLPEANGEIAKIWALLIYAFIVTIITVLAINRLEKLKDNLEDEPEKKQ